MRILEWGTDAGKNRRYIAELFILYSAAALSVYVFLSLFSALLIQSGNQLMMGLGALTYIANVYMCHQLPERSFTLFGQHISLCERCMAIMVGALAAYPAAVWRKRFPKFMLARLFIILALVPIGVDGVGQFIGLWESGGLVRIATGFLASFAILYFLLAEIMERFKIGKGLVRTGTAVPAAIPFVVLMMAVFVGAFFIGGHYHSENELVQRTMELDRNATFYDAHYIAPHAFSLSIRGDPFLKTYNDPVLMDVSSTGTSKHEYGAWAILALDEPAEYEGKYAFVSGGKGRYYYYDAWSGELVVVRQHNS